jgi:hypothetical protein
VGRIPLSSSDSDSDSELTARAMCSCSCSRSRAHAARPDEGMACRISRHCSFLADTCGRTRSNTYPSCAPYRSSCPSLGLCTSRTRAPWRCSLPAWWPLCLLRVVLALREWQLLLLGDPTLPSWVTPRRIPYPELFLLPSCPHYLGVAVSFSAEEGATTRPEIVPWHIAYTLSMGPADPRSTEELALRVGEAWGGLLNASFG